MIAALFVQPDGVYADVPDIELWDEARDARRYPGPWPVVAHPPCARWCKLAPVNEARYGIPIGSDGGCFNAALLATQEFGGILEHPAYSRAWRAHGIPWPPEAGGWQRDSDGGWCCYVEQGNYGHRARKPTWLYAVGTRLPGLRWGAASHAGAWISSDRPRAVLAAQGIAQLSKREAAATSPEFRDVLLSIAASAVSRITQRRTA
jgi:hypothetical protein